MTTNFSIISGLTVPSNYTWDSGTPLSTFAFEKAFLTTLLNTNTTLLSTNTYKLASTIPLSDNENNYIVSVGGVIQPPNTYTINATNKTLQFLITNSVSAQNIQINVVQLFNPFLPSEYISSLKTWVSSAPFQTRSFYLPGTTSLSADSKYYIVSIDGILQSTESYTINTSNQTVNFSSPVPDNTILLVTYLPKLNAPANWNYELTSPTAFLSLAGDPNYKITQNSDFIVNVGGVFQPTSSYVHDVARRRLAFYDTLPVNVPIYILQTSIPDAIDETLYATSGQTWIKANATTSYISGYAPGLKVVFDNNSTANNPPTNSIDNDINYNWNFGDYYNDSGNLVSLSCTTPIEHIFIMPGKYSVSLTQTQTITVSTIQAIITPLDRCLQKYCKYWIWEKLACSNLANRVTWEQAKTNNVFQKRWFYEPSEYLCNFNTTLSTSTNTQTSTKQYIVEVKEILPTAQLHCETRPYTGIYDLTVRLSPLATKTGSFPIDRIDWDLGDGTPIKTVVRQGSNSTDPELVNTRSYVDDPLCPRNFDIVHTYSRDINIYPVFYPSITAYSGNTGSYSSCSTTIGPIYLPTLSANEIKFLKSKNNSSGVLYSIQCNNTCSFVTNTSSSQNNIFPTIPTRPSNSLQDSYNLPVLYSGNNGTTYQIYTVQGC